MRKIKSKRWQCIRLCRYQAVQVSPGGTVVGVIAFRENAGRSQGDSFWTLLVTLFLPCRVATVATLPSALFDERFGSLGASWVFSFQPVLPPVYRPRFHLEDGNWARRLTQSPELGFRLWLFLSQSVFGFMQPLASLLACYCATVRIVVCDALRNSFGGRDRAEAVGGGSEGEGDLRCPHPAKRSQDAGPRAGQGSDV